MSKEERAAFIIAEALLDFHARNLGNASISKLHIHELQHFAKQGVKVRLK